MRKARILAIDDEEEMLNNYYRLLNKMGYDCLTQTDGKKALEMIDSFDPDIVISDLRMPDINGLDLLEKIRELNAAIPVILVTAYGDIPTAVESVKRGAFDFITKPFSSEQLRITLDRALKYKNLTDENRQLREQLKVCSDLDIIGKSAGMCEVTEVVNRVASTDANILLTGESGTGKEMVAKVIHSRSRRSAKPFVPVDCAALPENLLESELFGYEKGAFTGANTMKKGLLETAHEGTLFLDEIGEMSLSLQAKLLRTLQERVVRRLGSNKFIPVDIRIISATNRDLKKAVQQGSFREDLYYRLDVIHIHIPPLRERKEDIPLLAIHFLKRFNSIHKKNVDSISPRAMSALEAYGWPGNVRELQNVIERAVIMTVSGRIEIEDLPENLRSQGLDGWETQRTVDNSLQNPLPYREAKEAWLAAFEKNYLQSLLENTSVNISRAAEIAGINRKTIHRLIKRYNLDLKRSRN
ncbi:MAG: sigma-54-dependent transcriptional regulator [Thermodesulfovibrionales bacterium]